MAQYFGTFRNNVFHGKGEISFSNGSKYVGNFDKGLF